VTIEEAFGLVLAESMACGTPVIAFAKGATPEIVADGRTGYLVGDEDEMLRAVARIGEIDRAECRRHVEHDFSVDRVVREYEGCFRRVLDGRP
jgi:glycosyltransferase involved in cell wall biosynthesis